ncbi:MAG: VTT domain-containing protein [Actinomycetaceae bacterium]|nr:VTT domain-containing protein [Actinomycetaceae bacterium]
MNSLQAAEARGKSSALSFFERNFDAISTWSTWVGLVACAALALWAWKAGVLTSLDSLQEFLGKFGPLAPVIFIAFQIIQVVIPVLPGGISTVVAPAMFGWVLGFIYNYVGLVAGSLAAFLIAKRLGMPFIRQHFSKRLLERYESWTSNRRFTVYFAAAIAAPLAPDDFLVYLAGTTNMSLRTFTIIMLTCKPWAIIVYCWGFDFIVRTFFQ